MSGYVGNKRSVSFVSAELPIRKGLESIVEEDGSYRLLDGASLKRSDGNTVIHSDGTIEGVDLSPIQNQIDSIEADITSLNSSVDLVEASVNQIPPRLESFRNKIINGDMRINQRNASGALVTSGDFIVDRFRGYGQASSLSTLVEDNSISAIETTGCAKRLKISLTNGADNYTLIGQRIENSLKELSGKTVTISFWYYTDEEREFSIELLQYFGPTGSPSVRGIGATPITATTGAWTRVTQTVSIPSISSKTIGTDGLHMEMAVWFSDATNLVNSGYLGQQPSGTFFITGIQLEEGEIATPFEHRPYGLELSLCQRYYEKSERSVYVGFFGPLTSGAWALRPTVTFSTTKRTNPTITYPSVYDVWTTFTINAGKDGFTVELVHSGTADPRPWFTWTADAEL